MTREERNEQLRKWAKGRLPMMAAVDFLIDANQVPDRFVIDSPARDDLWLDFNALAEELSLGRLGYLSGGEQATLRLAISLYNGDLDRDFWRLDPERKAAFIRALTNHQS